MPNFDSLDANPEILRLQIQQAETQLAATQQRQNLGSATAVDVAEATDLIALLQARMAGDRIRFAQIRVKAAERRVEAATAFFNAGALRRSEVEDAIAELALEKARLNDEEARTPQGQAASKSNSVSDATSAVPATFAFATSSSTTRWPPLPAFEAFDNNPEILSLLLKRAESRQAEIQASYERGAATRMDVAQAAAERALVQARLAGDRLRFAQIRVEVSEQRVRDATALMERGELSRDGLAAVQSALAIEHVRLKDEEQRTADSAAGASQRK